MGIFDWFSKSNVTTPAPAEQRAVDYDRIIFGGGSGSYDDTGEIVNRETATSLIALRACVDVIAETIGSLSLHVYKNTDDARERAKQHPLYRVLHSIPNEDMSSVQWIESVFRRLLLDGASYDYIEFDGGVRPKAIYPILNCKPVRINGNLKYCATVGNQKIDLEQNQVLSVVDYSYDGVSGISRIHSCSRPLGIALGAEKFAGRFFKQGTVTNFALEYPQNLTPDQQQLIIDAYKDRHAGTDNAHNIMLLHGGAKAHVLNLSAEDAQLIERLKLSSLDIARLFRVPPHMIGINEGSPLASVEQQSISFYRNTIRPHIVKFEAELNRKLFLEVEKDDHYAEFDIASMLRGDSQAQDASHATGLTHGWYSINEVRKHRNMAPVEGGDRHLFPLNMSPVEDVDSTPVDSEVVEDKESAGVDINPLIASAIQRLVTKEIKAIQRKADLPDDEFRAWSEDFYSKHFETTKAVLEPVLQSINRSDDLENEAQQYCKLQFLELMQSNDRATLISEWQQYKSADTAEDIING
ncbi:phage portal protein [Rubinisphaera italica]|uniref:Phage portal protein n=1 Tax=Rubinisphaera italica TaxID=2527969 RepID=A0A5C5XM65_9PLAN|nr:phage portal protein [Rubinisphaera italica]TWT64247.1 Phage portal protein [Rubinisphaera italica]